MNGAMHARLPDGRLHLQHGPMDVLIECWGDRQETEAAYEQAWRRFRTILEELVAELPRLREPVHAPYPLFGGAVARRMSAAVWPHRSVFITPMAAVAGAVADELMEALLRGRRLRKACVNNGGDIALHAAAGERLQAGIVNDPARPFLNGTFLVLAGSGIGGVATSGWRGRSQSLGIADAVTILARSGAQADAAATLVANAVNVHHPAIERRPARTIKEDSDLVDLPVTVAVGALPAHIRKEALEKGVAAAAALHAAGAIHAAYLALQGETLAYRAGVALTLSESRIRGTA